MQYIYQHKEWPNFTWDNDKITTQLASIRHSQGLLLGKMKSLGFDLKQQASLETLSRDVIKSSAIEGEKLSKDQVRSSLARRLGIDIGGLTPSDRHVDGIVEMMLDATLQHEKELTKKRLFDWHGALFPTGRSGLLEITVANWRTESSGPMQVVSGPIGRENIHFEAPSAISLENEMEKFINWFNQENKNQDPIIKAAISHFWFVTIHPFEDGNGRIARALADMCLARADNSSERFYSMSASIEHERKTYYDILEKTQKGDTNITQWIIWFLACLEQAINNADNMLKQILHKSRVYNILNQHETNDRQRKVINRLFDNFFGKLTSSKYAKLAKCSQDTALRDIQRLIDYGVLQKSSSSGRSTNYELCDSLHLDQNA